MVRKRPSDTTNTVVGKNSLWFMRRLSYRQYALIVVGLLIVAGGVAIFADSGSSPNTPMDGNVALSLPTPGTPFAASSFWNTPLPTNTPVNPNNTAYINAIKYNLCQDTTVDPSTPPPACPTSTYNGALNSTAWSAPMYVVPAGQATVNIKNNCSGTNPVYLASLVNVPIPADAKPAVGSDAEIIIYQPSTNTEWEYWGLGKDASGSWDACYGGVITNVSQSNGIFPNYAGATATSLPNLGADPRIEELQAGQIDHAIGITIGDVATADLAKGVAPANTPGATTGISWPATRTDGDSTNPLTVPEGTRFRLSPSLNLDALNLSPVAKTIAVAAQKYGFVVDDSCPQPCITIRIGDPTPYITAGLPNPYTTGPGVGGVGNNGLFAGLSASATMKNFPWNQLQALPYNYGEPGSPSGDTTPPTISVTAPADGATVNGPVAVTAAASDNVGVVSVQFELDGKPLGAALTKAPYTYPWNTVGVSNGSHTLTAIASDAAGNTKTAANVTVTVKNPDTTPPSTPVGLTATVPTSATVKLSWTASTDNVGVVSYRVYRDGSTSPLASVAAPATTYTDAAVSAKTPYTYSVVALDAAGNQSTHSTTVNVTTPSNPDTTPPSTPKDLTGQAVGQTAITLSWEPSADTGGSGLAGYHLYRNGTLISSPSSATYTDTGLMPGTRYTYKVSAYDNAANGSAASQAARITTQGSSPDKTPPTAPNHLRVVAKSRTQTTARLAWDASSDSGGSGLGGYEIYRNNALVGSSGTTTFADSGLTTGTTYSYYVVATDNAGNLSAHSHTLTLTTKHPWWDIRHLGN